MTQICGSVRLSAISWESCTPVEDTPDRMAGDILSFIYIMLTDNSNKEHSIMTLCCHSSCVDVLFSREKVEYCTNSTKLDASEQQCYRPISAIWAPVLHDWLKCLHFSKNIDWTAVANAKDCTVSAGSKDKMTLIQSSFCFCNFFLELCLFKLFLRHQDGGMPLMNLSLALMSARLKQF